MYSVSGHILVNDTVTNITPSSTLLCLWVVPLVTLGWFLVMCRLCFLLCLEMHEYTFSKVLCVNWHFRCTSRDYI